MWDAANVCTMARQIPLEEISMKTRHIVLRADRLGSRNVFNGPAMLESAAPAALSVQIEELDRRDIATVTRDADVVALAPAMPIRLIAPTDDHAATPAEAGDLAWGVHAVKADSSPRNGQGIVVAVLDTGIDAGHPAFQGVELLRRNFTPDSDDDTHGHGTHCAGTIFGRAVSGTRIGVAPGVQKALIGKVLGNDGGSSEQIVTAIQWACDNGAHVISMSLGMDFPGYARFLREQEGFPEELAISRALEGYRANVLLFERLATLIRARSNPTVIVAAAGNESRRDTDPRFELGVSPPAVSEGIISVAAVGRRGGLMAVAGFSNTGANVCAPGVDVVSAGLRGGLRTMSGTSMATPHVAGVAALWAQQLRSLGILSALNLTAKIVGGATFQGLAGGIDPFDVGAGLVLAPQP